VSRSGEPLLTVEDLRTELLTPDGSVRAVNGVDLTINRGEMVGVVGESGCGKTMLALSILRLVPAPGRVTSGRIRFEGTDVLALDREQLRRMRGASVAMSFQDPMRALNALMTIRSQVEETITAHDRFPPSEAPGRVVSLLEKVAIPSAGQRARDYPHQFSGGMRQRVMIAMAIANEPKLLIADEPPPGSTYPLKPRSSGC
jgi:peptide/nickel transport system ATP-binding protein